MECEPAVTNEGMCGCFERVMREIWFTKSGQIQGTRKTMLWRWRGCDNKTAHTLFDPSIIRNPSFKVIDLSLHDGRRIALLAF